MSHESTPQPIGNELWERAQHEDRPEVALLMAYQAGRADAAQEISTSWDVDEAVASVIEESRQFGESTE